MKTSFITTVFNEANDISSFLDSLTRQTAQLDEIIIVDAGSTDKTIDKLKVYQQKSKIPVKIIIKHGNRSIGRNEAIKQASGDIIACSDAGCILDKNWLKNITAPFRLRHSREGGNLTQDFDVVSGFYHPKTTNVFEQCLATYTCTMPDKVDKKNFLPSSRSIAFKKTAWKKVNGYPEHLNTCEDLIFASNLKKAGFLFYFAENAIVSWPQRKNLLQAFTQFLSYAIGDGQARFIRKSISFLYLRYLAAAILLFLAVKLNNPLLYIFIIFLFIIYLLWSIQKNYKYVKNAQAFFYLPVLQITADIAVLIGTTIGLTRHIDIEKHN